MTPSASPSDHAAHQPGRAGHHSRPPGVIAGAVLRSARLSAGISQATLAVAADLEEETIAAWEKGSSPLASVPLPQVSALEKLLTDGGTSPHLVADLGAAAWCDLVVLAIADHEDTACLTADPITSETAFGELLAWTLTGHIPARYRPYAEPGPLLTDPALIAQVIRALAAR